MMFEMPSEDELRASSAAWAKRVGPFFIDNWPPDVLALSAPTIFIDLPQDSTDLFELRTFESIATPIAAEIDAKIGWERRFFRLNSRSPKDAPWPFELPLSCSGKEIMSVLACSERMLDDLCYFRNSAAPPKLCLREFWPEARPAWEYRCFIKDGDILAVAEYANRDAGIWDSPPEDADRDRRKLIDSYLREVVMPRMHVKTVVVDVFEKNRGELRLIELNPYGLSDPVGALSYDAIEQGIPSIARLPRAATKSLNVP